MLIAYKYRLYPSACQRDLLSKHFGCARFVYNWALANKIAAYEATGKTLSRFDLDKQLTLLKQRPETEWLQEVVAQSMQAVLRHLEAAYSKFFREKKGFPKFKSRHKSKASFECPQAVRVQFEAGTIQLPKIGRIKAVLSRRFAGTVKTTTVSMTATGKYYAAVLVDEPIAPLFPPSITAENSIGIDVGLKDFATLSTGEKIKNPRFLRASLSRLRRVSRQHSKKQKGSSNRIKSRQKLARCHEKVAAQRQDFLQKISTRIVRESQGTVAVENLNIAGMLKNRALSRAISDVSWASFLSMIRYKCGRFGKNYVEIGRFEPSSRMCSCGVVNKQLRLQDRHWICASCGVVHDRDLLAAKNIVRFALGNKIGRGTPESTLGEIPVRELLNQESISQHGDGVPTREAESFLL